VVAVVLVVLDQAEVEAQLAHGPGHVALLCPSVASCRGDYPRRGLRDPRMALPTRTYVAPAAIASSRSLLIPALMAVAPGWADATAAATAASRSKAGPGSRPRGATAITPPSRRPGAASTASATRGTSSMSAPPRSGSPSRLTCTSAS